MKKISFPVRGKLRTLGKLGLPLFMTFVVGCGGSDGGGATVAANNDGNNQPTPTGTQRQFSYPNFSSSSRATLVVGNTPAGETSSPDAQVVVAVNQGLGALARFSLTRGSEQSTRPEAACATADLHVLRDLMGPNEPVVQNRVSSQVLRRFQDLPEGSQQDFQLIIGYRTKRAEKVLRPDETVHCTIFAELDDEGQPCISRSKALAVAQAFDSNNPVRPGSGIYDQVRAVFGSEWTANGGIDGDHKIVLFFFRSATLGPGLYGYTSPADSDPNATSFSNKAEILYLNADKDELQIMSTLAHEFQHLICENQKVIRQGTFPAGAREENVSLNEGLSELAEEVCGFTLENGNDLLADYINDYLSRPEDHEFFNFNATGVGYGQGYLFYRYIMEHYGTNTIRALATSANVGMANLDAGLPNGFAENFRRWTIANWATNLSGAPAIYQYPSGFRTNGTYAAGSLTGVIPFELTNGQSASSPNMGAWSVAYFTYAGGNGRDLSLSVNVPANSPAASIFEGSQGIFSRLDQ